jgi:hypothetical protein
MARISKVAAGVAARKGKAEKKVRTTNWRLYDYLSWSLTLYFLFQQFDISNQSFSWLILEVLLVLE